MHANAVNPHETVVRALDGHAHVTERLKRGQAVLAFQKSFHFGYAIREGAQHDRTVRHRLVARNADITGNRATGLKTERHLLFTVVCHVSLS